MTLQQWINQLDELTNYKFEFGITDHLITDLQQHIYDMENLPENDFDEAYRIALQNDLIAEQIITYYGEY